MSSSFTRSSANEFYAPKLRSPSRSTYPALTQRHDIDDSFLTGLVGEESVDLDDTTRGSPIQAMSPPRSPPVQSAEQPSPRTAAKRAEKRAARLHKKQLAYAMNQLRNMPQEMHRSMMEHKINTFNNALMEQGSRDRHLKSRIEEQESKMLNKKKERVRMIEQKKEQQRLRQFERLDRKRAEVNHDLRLWMPCRNSGSIPFRWLSRKSQGCSR